MAYIVLHIKDQENGGVFYEFTSDTPIPAVVEQVTPAQVFAIELKKYLDELAGD
jgi:hypothetical protein